MRLRHSAEYQ